MTAGGFLRVGGRLDRYVARLFVLSYLSAFFLVVGLYLIVDMAVNADDYLRPNAEGETTPSSLVARYYVFQVPFLYLQMSPYVTLVAGMFTAAKMTRYREVVAALNAGVSKQRLFATVLAGAALLALGMFGLRELATSELGRRRDALLERIMTRRDVRSYEDFHVGTPTGHKVGVEVYYPEGPDGRGGPTISGLKVHYRDGDQPVGIMANEATPLADGRWRLDEGERLVAARDALTTTPLETLDEVRFDASDIELAWKGRNHPMELSFSESRTLLERDPSNAQYRTLLQYHITFPLAGLLLLGVGLPFALGQERGRAGERVGKGFFLCVAYFAFEFVTRTLGLQGHIGPLFASWVPVIAFGALGAVLFSTMRS